MTASRQWAFRMVSVPDAEHPPSRLRAGGDVRLAIQEDFEHFVRTMAAFPFGSAATAIRYLYQPVKADGDPSDRLDVHLLGWAVGPGIAAMPLLTHSAPLGTFYDLVPCPTGPIPRDAFHAGCDVVRRQVVLAPTVPPEFNAKALPAYYAVRSFEPREDNDYLGLDDVLDGLTTPVLIEICIEPTDIRPLLSAHTRYLWRLQQVNRSWEDEEDLRFGEDWGRIGISSREMRSSPKLLRRREPLADQVLREVQRFHETLCLPHLQFHIRILAEDIGTALLIASVVAESAFRNGSYQLFSYGADDEFLKEVQPDGSGPRVIEYPAMSRVLDGLALQTFEGFSGLATVAPPEEMVGAMRLPIASHASPRCLRKNTDPPVLPKEDVIVFGHDDRGEAEQTPCAAGSPVRGIPTSALRKHVFLSGVPGSGKTTAMIGLLVQLFRQCIPFIVFEPGKTEYWLLKCLRRSRDPVIRRLARKLRVYTPGNDRISAMRFNPLRRLPQISLDQHIENLLGCFQAAMPMFPAFLGLLGEALELVYEWHPDPADPPSMVEVCATAEEVLAAKRYSGEVHSNLRAAIEVRLGALIRRGIGRVFRGGPDHPSISELAEGDHLLELPYLTVEHGCLLTLFLSTRLREYVRTHASPQDGLRLAMLLEEAHNLVGTAHEAIASEERADPKAFATESICRMLAELRSLGVGIVIADQLPSGVAPAVIKNTSTKLAFRQPEKEDREQIGGSMLFGPIEDQEIARLRVGNAYLYAEGYFAPRLIRTTNWVEKLQLPGPPTGEEILPYLRKDQWFTNALEDRLASALESLMLSMDRFEQLHVETRRLAARICGRLVDAASLPPNRQQDAKRRLIGCVRFLRNRLHSEFRAHLAPAWRRFADDFEGIEVRDEPLRQWREQVTHRYETVICAGATALLALLDDMDSRFTQPTNEKE
jgi:hypothetical protein